MSNKKNTTKTIRGILTFLYFFILSLTTFHHHPANFTEASATVLGSASTEKSTHNLTAEECPIINFSKNSFNSTLAFNSSIELFFYHQKSVDGETEITIQLKTYNSPTRRGPPAFTNYMAIL